MPTRLWCCPLAALALLFTPNSGSLAADPAASSPQPLADSANHKIEQALDSIADLDFDKATFIDVQKFLEKQYAINIYLDRKALEDANVPLDTEMTFRLKGISLRSALRLLLRDLDLKMFPKDGMLWITTKDVADDFVETRAYPVLDLVLRPATDPWDVPQPDFNSLIDVIANTVRPDSWPAGSGPAPIERLPSAGVILISQTYENQQQVAQLLAMLRKTRDQQMSGGKLKPMAERSWQPVLPKETAAPAIRKALVDRFDFDYDKVPLSTVADFIADQWKIPVLLDRKGLTDANVSLDAAVSLTMKDCPLGTGLNLLLQPHELQWIVDHEVLSITTKDIADDTTSVRVYPVSDLDDWDQDRGDGRRFTRPHSLMDAIHNGASPDSWTATGGPGALEYYPFARALVVTQTEQVHREVEQLLASIRQARDQQFPKQTEPPAINVNDETLHLKVYLVQPLFQPGGGMGTGGMGGGLFAVDDDTQKKPESTTPVQQVPPPAIPAAQPQPAPQTTVPQTTVPQPVAPPPFDPTDDLARIIPQVIEPASWKEAGGKGIIDKLPGRLIVLQTNRVHAQIAKLLRELR